MEQAKQRVEYGEAEYGRYSPQRVAPERGQKHFNDSMTWGSNPRPAPYSLVTHGHSGHVEVVPPRADYGVRTYDRVRRTDDIHFDANREARIELVVTSKRGQIPAPFKRVELLAASVCTPKKLNPREDFPRAWTGEGIPTGTLFPSHWMQPSGFRA